METLGHRFVSKTTLFERGFSLLFFERFCPCGRMLKVVGELGFIASESHVDLFLFEFFRSAEISGS
jgi:hypothetical protein